MTTPEPGVHIGLPEIYSSVQRLITSVDRLTCRLESVAVETQDQEARIKALEARRFPLHIVSGLVAVVSLLSSIVIGILALTLR